MEKSVIKEICDWKRGEDKNIHGSEKYWRIMRENKEIYDKFCESLSAEQKEIYDELTLADSQAEYEAALTYFSEGFKTGLLLGLECAED